MKVKLKKLRSSAKIPTRGSLNSAGYDLYACLDKQIIIKPNEIVKIPTGIAIELPEGYVGLIFARSGICLKKGLVPANKVGVCDSDYRGEYLVMLKNESLYEAKIESGDRIAQLVVLPIATIYFEEVDSLNITNRGEGGFGSTGY